MTFPEFDKVFRPHILEAEGTKKYIEKDKDGKVIGYSIFGLFSKYHDLTNIKTISDAMQVYYKEYFLANGLQNTFKYAPKTTAVLFDAFVNHYNTFAKGLKQQAQNLLQTTSDAETAKKLITLRLAEYERLSNTGKSFANDLNGWKSRLKKVTNFIDGITGVQAAGISGAVVLGGILTFFF